MKTSKVLKFVGFGLLGLGFITLAIFVTMKLWNWLIPELFHGPYLTFWQTAGLLILSKILLSGLSPRPHHHHGRGHWHHHKGECGNREEWWKRFRERRKAYFSHEKQVEPKGEGEAKTNQEQ